MPFSKPLSASVRFGVKKGAKFLGGLTPLNPLGGYKNSAIRGIILSGFRRVGPLFLLRNFDPFLTEMVPILLRNFDTFSEMVLFLLRNFDPFHQKWYHLCR